MTVKILIKILTDQVIRIFNPPTLNIFRMFRMFRNFSSTQIQHSKPCINARGKILIKILISEGLRVRVCAKGLV